jgi:hypothetical protein
MHKNLAIYVSTSVASLFFATAHPALAQTWTVGATPTLASGAYDGAADRDRYLDRGITFTADYLDQAGVVASVSHTSIAYKSGTSSTEQDNLLLSGHWSQQLTALPARLTTRLDVYRISNNDATGDTDGVSVAAGQVSLLSKDALFYADLGYARSRYQNDLTVDQFTPTVGFALNDGKDWVQLRAYAINGLNPARAQGKSDTSALEAKWTHYFAGTPGSGWMPASATVSVLGGERIYAVDMDAQSVYNLSGIQTGAATLGLNWKLSKGSSLLVLAGQNRFRDATLDNDYRLNVAYAAWTLNF